MTDVGPAPRAPSRWRLNRLGRRFMWASMGVLAVAAIMIVIAAQQMFISNQDLGTLLWIMVPAAVAAAVAAWLLSAPIARDAQRLSLAAREVAAGHLDVRTGIERNDELGDAARDFERMTDRLSAVEHERALMLSSVSHDLRTPLASLRASVEALRDGLPVDPDAHLKNMERQVESLAGLVDDLGLHTRLASGTLEMPRTRLDLGELVDETIESMGPIAHRAGVGLQLAGDERIPVEVAPAQLARVLRNLLDNAIRHSPDGGTVRVTVTRDGPDARVRVTDDGPGFPADLRAVAFEPFTRGDAARDVRTGIAGLGLAIARGIVTAHDGAIEIGPGPGGNVSFTVPAARSLGR